MPLFRRICFNERTVWAAGSLNSRQFATFSPLSEILFLELPDSQRIVAFTPSKFHIIVIIKFAIVHTNTSFCDNCTRKIFFFFYKLYIDAIYFFCLFYISLSEASSGYDLTVVCISLLAV